MDPMSLGQLLFELSSVTPETFSTPTDKLTPGCVLADAEWNRHVVVAVPTVLSATTLAVPIRHLHGGHTLTRHYQRGHQVNIHRHTLMASHISYVPRVPRCFVPEDPEVGDRVYHHHHEALSLGGGRFFEFDGEQWRQVTTTTDGRRSRDLVRYFPDIRPMVSDPSDSSPYGWYTYQPAGHVPHLYVDGMPMPARSAGQLAVGDVVRLPGTGRLTVRETRLTPDGVSLSLELTTRSVHRLRYLTWATRPGEIIEHQDSGRTGALYATEPRPSELRISTELRSDDTVITSWGSRSSAVAVVAEVWRQPVRAVMHLRAQTVDGRHLSIRSDATPRHLVLHRPARQSLRATA
ncbi:hypothetical protein ACWD7M_16195 [Streptomyces griseus]